MVSSMVFYKKKLTGIAPHTLMKRSHSSPFLPWFSNDPKKMNIEKNRLHSLYKRSGLHWQYLAFARTINACRIKSLHHYQAYVAHLDTVIPKKTLKLSGITLRDFGRLPQQSHNFSLRDRK